MNKKQADKFATLYHFLKDQVPDENFDLTVIATCDSEKSLRNVECGTAACVCGWMPTVFPRTFKLLYDGMFGEWILDSPYGVTYVAQFKNFFGVTEDEAEEITEPGLNKPADDSRKGVLKRMKALALKYGWEI